MKPLPHSPAPPARTAAALLLPLTAGFVVVGGVALGGLHGRAPWPAAWSGLVLLSTLLAAWSGLAYWYHRLLRREIGEPLARLTSLAREALNPAEGPSPDEAARGLDGAWRLAAANVAELGHHAHRLDWHLREAEARFQTLLELVPDPALVLTLEGRCLAVNTALTNLFGGTRAQWAGADADTLGRCLPVEALLRLGRHSRDERCAFRHVEMPGRTGEGATRALAITVQAIRLYGAWGVLVLARDREEARRLERQVAGYADAVELMVEERTAHLKACHDALAQAFDRLPVPALAIGDEGQVLFANAAVKRLAPGAAACTSLAALIDALYPEADVRRRFVAWLTQGGADRFEVEHEGMRWCWVTEALAEPGTAALGLIYALPAPTPAAPTPAAPLPDLLSPHVLHDLEEPLRSLVGLSMLIQDEESGDEGARGAYLDMLRTAALRLSARLEGLFRLNRLLRQPLRPEPLDVAAVVAAAAQRVQAQGPPRPFAIEPPPRGAVVYADGALLTDALAEVLANACTHGAGPGVVVRVAVTAVPGAHVLVLDDDGPGFAEVLGEDPWPLFRSSLPEGGGVGLPFVQAVAARHGGTAALGANPGGGARITLTLPMAPSVAASGDGAEVAPEKMRALPRQ